MDGKITVPTLRLKYVDHFVDQTGRARFYFRRPKGARIALRGLPGSDQFQEDYAAALAGRPARDLRPGAIQPAPIAAAPASDPRTFDKLLDLYYAAPEFKGLADSTRAAYKRVFVRWLVDEGIGHRPVAGFRREHVTAMIGKRSETPGAANDLLKKISLLMSFAIRNGWVAADPTAKMRKFKGGEWHTWTEEEIEVYERKWIRGSKARFAFALHLFTGQRVSDVAKMLWTDVVGGKIRVRQRKTGKRVLIPIHPALAAEIFLAPRSGPAMVATEYGRAFTAKGLSNWMADRIGEAGLPDECITHGLRKAAARRMAEAGCSAKQIASITGHKSLSEVERYVREAEQDLMAVDAIERVANSPHFQISQKPADRREKIAVNQ
jgi:integrase